ncbi:hypothetical protein LZ32DRAFT_603731 [Colletotrichum eremochloae]|nr:hypothetical protein LZ32DRAFT_603731 [Colletotrichum eremochloae]
MRFTAIYIAIFAVLQATVYGQECNDDHNCGGVDCTLPPRPGVAAGGVCNVAQFSGKDGCACIY